MISFYSAIASVSEAMDVEAKVNNNLEMVRWSCQFDLHQIIRSGAHNLSKGTLKTVIQRVWSFGQQGLVFSLCFPCLVRV